MFSGHSTKACASYSMVPYENLNKFIRKFMGAASGYKNSFNPQFLTSSDRRVRQIDPLRDATMLKMLDEIARDDTFRIEGMKKGTEKAVFENVNILNFMLKFTSKLEKCEISP